MEVKKVEVPSLGTVEATRFFPDKLTAELTMTFEEGIDEDTFFNGLLDRIYGLGPVRKVTRNALKFGDEPDKLEIVFQDADWALPNGRLGYLESQLNSLIMPTFTSFARTFIESPITPRAPRQGSHERFAHRR